MTRRRGYKRPRSLNLSLPFHRVVVLRAYHALLSAGLDEDQAKAKAGAYALRYWDEFNNQ